MGYDIFLRDPVTGRAVEVTEASKTEAHVNITYRYGRYYYEVYEEGIRAIYGKSAFESIAILEEMVTFLREKYQKGDEWVITRRCKTVYFDENGRETEPIASVLNENRPVRYEEVEIEVSEGDTDDYLLETAANAMRPLYQLIALSKMWPDCIWDGD